MSFRSPDGILVNKENKQNQISARTPKVSRTKKIEPSPMTLAFQTRTCNSNSRPTVAFIGEFNHSKEELTKELKRLQYEVMSEVSEKLTCIICNGDNGSLEYECAAAFGLPMLSEIDLFTQTPMPDTESDSESECELYIDEEESILMYLSDDEEQEVSRGKGKLAGTRVAFMGRFSTPFLNLKHLVQSHGAFITSIQEMINPATHIVLSEDDQCAKEFRRQFSACRWIRNAVFLKESQLLDICKGEMECPPPKSLPVIPQVIPAMESLRIGESSICKKRKIRPPTTPKKEVKPLFSFLCSPERKKGRSDNFKEPIVASIIPISQEEPIPRKDKETLKLPSSTSVGTLDKPKSKKLEGKHFVLLGKFKRTKQVVTRTISSHSGVVPLSSHLSKKISYVVYGTGSEKTKKYKAAVEKGISCISEEALFEMIQ